MNAKQLSVIVLLDDQEVDESGVTNQQKFGAYCRNIECKPEDLDIASDFHDVLRKTYEESDDIPTLYGYLCLAELKVDYHIALEEHNIGDEEDNEFEIIAYNCWSYRLQDKMVSISEGEPMLHEWLN